MKSGFLADFPLVKSGEAYSNCGVVFAKGCLNVSAHNGTNLDGQDMTGKIVVKYMKNSCHRPLCPVCWGDWANRECDVIVHRLASFQLRNRQGKLLRPIHIIIGVPHEDYGLPFPEMRKKGYRALKKTGCLGGVEIYHPRRKNKRGEWYFSPHFHIIGYGWIRDTKRNYVHSGYIVRNLKVRKSVRATAFYQLSHCGVSKKFRTITWFGHLAYNKLRVSKIVEEPLVCPLCGAELRKIVYSGKNRKIMKIMGSRCRIGRGFRYLDLEGWEYAQKKVYPKRFKPFPRMNDRAVLPRVEWVNPHIVKHTYADLRKANPIMPEWMINRALGMY